MVKVWQCMFGAAAQVQIVPIVLQGTMEDRTNEGANQILIDFIVMSLYTEIRNNASHYITRPTTFDSIKIVDAKRTF